MTLARSLVAAAIAALSINAHAVTIASVALPTDGSWAEFDFDQAGSAIYDMSTQLTSFSFTLTQNSVLRVVDTGFSGDQFTINVGGQTFSTSTPVVQSDSEDPIFDASTNWSDARFSKGEWLLTAGSYTVTGKVTASPFDGGYGYMSVTAVPEPESYAMLLAGLGLMAIVARRRA
jgi:hypothetical protein